MRQRDLRTRELDHTSAEDTSAEDGDTAPQPQPQPRPAANRRPGATGAIAALVVVVVMLGVAFFASISLYRSARGAHGVSATGVPTPETPTVAPSPTLGVSALQAPKRGTGLAAGVEVTSFVLTGTDEGWGTGGVNMNSAIGLPESSIVLHYAAGSWTQVGAALPDIDLNGIDMISSSEGWAMGLSENSEQSVMLHIRNGAWQQVSLPDDPKAAASVIAMRTPDEGWLAMSNPKGAYSEVNTSLFHYAAGAWSFVPNPIHDITDIAPIADGEAWVIGWTTDGSSELVHVRGGLATVELTGPRNSTFARFRVFAPNDIWIESSEHRGASAETDDLPLSYHFDGVRWSQASLLLPQGAQHVGRVSSTTAWSFTSTAQTSSSGFPYAQIVSIYSSASGQWQALSVPYNDLGALEIVSQSSTDIWAIGIYMVTTQESNDFSTVSQYVLLHYTDGTWTEYGR